MLYFLLGISAIFIGWFVRDLVFGALNQFLKYQQTVRLKNIVGSSVAGHVFGKTGRKSLPFNTILSFFENNLDFLLKQKYFEEYLDYFSKLLQRMNRTDIKPVQVFGYQILLSVGASLLFGLLSENIELSVIAFLLGAALPILWLRDKALVREKILLKELPNALETLSLCSEAGLSLEQAMDQYVKNANAGPLKEEFSGLLEQTRSGSSRKDALESIRLRLNLIDFSLFSTSLIHAERFGTGISMTLRQLSLTMRDKQSQKAEKAVQEMPVKMLIPLILFIMPVTFLIIFGPILLQFFHQ